MKIEPFQLFGKMIQEAFIDETKKGDILHLRFTDLTEAEIGAELLEDEISGKTFCSYRLYIELRPQ